MYHILLTTKRFARTVGYQLDMLILRWGLHHLARSACRTKRGVSTAQVISFRARCTTICLGKRTFACAPVNNVDFEALRKEQLTRKAVRLTSHIMRPHERSAD